MDNPFIYGKVVRGKHFTNREKEIKALLDDLTSGQNVLIFSPRRYGKTSLVLKVREKLVAGGVMVAYIDFFPLGTKHRLVEAYGKALLKATQSKLDDAVEFARDIFSRLRPSITVRPEGLPDIELSFSDKSNDIDRALEEVMESAERIAVKKAKRLVVIFDEFQEFEKLDKDFDKKLRAVIQHHANVSYVFMGSKRHLIERLFFIKDRALYQSAKPFPLGNIPREKFVAYIRRAFKDSQMTITDNAIGRILDLSGSHPYYTQQLCHEVWARACEGREAVNSTVDEAAKDVVDIQSYAYTEIWDATTAHQRALLFALSREPNATIQSADFMRRFSLGAASKVQYSAKVLAEKQLIEKVNGGWAVSDVFFQRWILQRTATG